MRMKKGRDRYLEANVSEVKKALKLEETEIGRDPFLDALLEYVLHDIYRTLLTLGRRGRLFNESNNSPHESDHKTIAEVEVGAVISLFTCTVEVRLELSPAVMIYLILYSSQVLSVSKTTVPDTPAKIYVTDYTKNPSLMPVHQNWCPPALAPYVLRIEMWDSAAEAAQEMRPHEFYTLSNVRMRVNPSGHYEAKFVEGRKVKRLDEDELEAQPHLAALLECVLLFSTCLVGMRN